jgi:trk system potassium uptake protein TrkH
VIDFRPILFILGLLLVILALTMTLPAAADLAVGHPDWQVFLASAAATLFIGVGLVLAFRAARFRVTVHQTFILTTLSWVVLTAFAGLPFVFSGLGLSYADAYFEAMSGLTTTGSTVITGLDHSPPGILLWRALLQWLGGIGIIVMAVAVLPMLRVGGMQLFRTESSDQSQKALPRTAQIAAYIAALYFGLTLLWAFLLWLAGLSQFDAVSHAMTTIATGGYSTVDGSIGHFRNPAVEVIVTVGMIAGSLPFVGYLAAVRGRLGDLLRDSQVHWFLAIAAGVVAVMTLWTWSSLDAPPLTALRLSAFNVVSVMTGTGYSSTDYGQWGALALTILFFLMFVGGCTGGTTGGIKVFRFQVLFATVRVQIGQLIRPHGVFVAHYNGKPISDSVTSAVLGFYFMFFAAFTLVALALALHGHDFVTSVSGAATAIANVGPGLGEVIGPAGNFSSLEDSAKWILSAAMLLGRLELFTVLVLFLPSFWRR